MLPLCSCRFARAYQETLQKHALPSLAKQPTVDLKIGTMLLALITFLFNVLGSRPGIS